MNKTYFFGQHENEQLQFYLYRHWIYLFIKVKNHLFILFLTLFLLYLWIKVEKPESVNVFVFFENNLTLFLFFYVILIVNIHFIFLRILHYIFNVIIITDNRFIDIDQTVFFENNRESIDLTRIQDIQAHANGFLQNLFNFGQISLTFATIQDPKVINFIPDPLGFIERINAIKREYYVTRDRYGNIELEQMNYGPSNDNDIVI